MSLKQRYWIVLVIILLLSSVTSISAQEDLIPIDTDNMDQVKLLGALYFPTQLSDTDRVDFVFSPDSRLLLGYTRSYANGTAMMFWDAVTLQPKFEVPYTETGRRIYSVVFSPDSTRLAVLNWEFIELWDIQTFTRIAQWEHNLGYFIDYAHLQFTPDSQWLIEDFRYVIHRWDAVTGEYQDGKTFYDSLITNIAFSSDSKWGVVSLHEPRNYPRVRSVKVFDLETGEDVATFELLQPSEIGRLFFNLSNSKLYAIGGYALYIWDMATLTEENAIKRTGAIDDVNADGTVLLMYGDEYGRQAPVHTVNLITGEIGVPFEGRSLGCSGSSGLRNPGFRISPNGKFIILCDYVALHIIDGATGIERASIPEYPPYINFYSSFFSPDGALLVVQNAEKGKSFSECANRLVDVEKWAVGLTLIAGGCGPIFFNPSGTLLIASGGSSEQTMVVFGIPTNQLQAYASVPGFILPSSVNLRAASSVEAEIMGSVSGAVVIGGVDPSKQFFYLTSHNGWVRADPAYIDLRQFSTIDDLRVIEN